MPHYIRAGNGRSVISRKNEEFNMIIALTSFITRGSFGACIPDGGALDGNRYRVLISTDIGGTDEDDIQSMIHYLLYADLFDTEGLLSSPFGQGRAEDILKVIAKYEQDYPRLKEHSDNYPAPDYLCSITKQGAIEPSPPEGYSDSTEGSKWMARCARKSDTRPLYVLVWGLISDVAQALHDAPDIAGKIRVIFIGGPNKKWDLNAYNYIEQNFPDLWMIENNSTYRGWWVGGNQDGDMGNQSFVEENIREHGASGDYFARFKKGKIKMGDTPTMAYLLRGDPDDPTGDSWGGRFARVDNRPRFVFAESASESDNVELFGIFELLLKTPEICGQNLELKAHFRHSKRLADADGFLGDDGFHHVRFMPQNEGCWQYVIESSAAEINGRTGQFTCVAPSLSRRYDSQPSHKNWWTDDPDPAFMEQEHYGVKTINQWRVDYLRDFAQRMDRCIES